MSKPKPTAAANSFPESRAETQASALLAFPPGPSALPPGPLLHLRGPVPRAPGLGGGAMVPEGGHWASEEKHRFQIKSAGLSRLPASANSWLPAAASGFGYGPAKALATPF